MKKILEVRPWVYVMAGVALLLIEMMVIIPSGNGLVTALVGTLALGSMLTRSNGLVTALVGTLALGLMLTGSIASIFKSIKGIRKIQELKERKTGDVTRI